MSERTTLHPAQLRQLAKGGRLRLGPGFHLLPAEGDDGFILEVANHAAVPAELWTPSPADRLAVDDLEQVPRARDMVLPHLPAAVPALFSAAGGAGKTSVVMQLIVPAVAAGLPIGNATVPEGVVVVLTAEDRREDLLRQLFVVAQRCTAEQREKLAANVIVKDVVGCGAKLTRMVDGGGQVAGDVRDIIDWLLLYRPRLVIIDTLSRWSGTDETNEGMARVVEAMDWIARETGAAVLILHHTGKQQMRDRVDDQYASRGGSALSDNCRSALHLSVVQTADPKAPVNAAEHIAGRRLLRLTHSKCNGAPLQPDLYLVREHTPHGVPRLVVFEGEFAHGSDAEQTWAKIKGWLLMNHTVPFPTKGTIEALGSEYGSRDAKRKAITWAMDHGQLVEAPHPSPTSGRRVYLKVPTRGGGHE